MADEDPPKIDYTKRTAKAPEAYPEELPPDPVRQRRNDPLRQVRETGAQGAAGGLGTLLTENVLVVNQKTKLIELTNEYSVFDKGGQQIGSVVEVGQGAVKKVVRALSSYDQFFTHALEVRDTQGVVVLRVTRPAKLLKSRVIVAGPNGSEIGQLVQKNAFGKITFEMLDGSGQKVGALSAQNWRAWNFSISDTSGAEVAKVTKTFEGIAKTMFTTADNYVVEILRPIADPLRSLVVASALTIDTALKQDSRGFG